MRGLIVGTGYSLREQLAQIPYFDGLVFVCNNTPEHLNLTAGRVPLYKRMAWLACDPKWHAVNGRMPGHFDKWHWDADICAAFNYSYVKGVWVGGLTMEPGQISLGHCSAHQLLNLAANQYGCGEIVLVGHDFHCDAPQRHYFDDVSDVAGEYPAELRKHSLFDKGPDKYDLLDVYKKVADQGAVPIFNATPGSKLPWFQKCDLQDFLI